MKTIFQLGLPRNNMIWMGQAAAPTDQRRIDVDEFCGKLNPAMDTWNKVNDFIKQPNYRQALGDQAATFDNLKSQADAIADSAIYAQGTVCLGGAGSITPTDENNGRIFAGIMNSMSSILAFAKPVTPVTAARPGVPTAAKPAAPAPSGGLSPLAIGGLAAAGIVAVALVVS